MENPVILKKLRRLEKIFHQIPKKNFAMQLKNPFRNIELTWMKRKLKT